MCGIIGLFNPSSNVANEIYDGLIQLQHRGQDAAGIATLEQSKMQLHKDLGLVTEAFKSEKSKIDSPLKTNPRTFRIARIDLSRQNVMTSMFLVRG